MLSDVESINDISEEEYNTLIAQDNIDFSFCTAVDARINTLIYDNQFV